MIRASVKLKMVNVHKLQDFATCFRKYYWRYVRNLESKWINVAFWYGSRCGAGAEALLQGKSWQQAKKMMNAEDKRYFSRYEVGEAAKEEIEIGRRIIDVALQKFVTIPEFGEMKISGNQESFAVPLKQSKLLFCGTKDGMGSAKGRRSLFEIKNWKTISDNLKQDLIADMQTNGYAYSDRLLNNPPVQFGMFLIFKKTSKKMKQGGRLWSAKLQFVDDDGEFYYENVASRLPQTVDEFVQEVAADIYLKSEYFEFKSIRLGASQVKEVGADIEGHSVILNSFYERMSEEELLDPHNWPRCVAACSNFSGCEYRRLCFEPNRREVWLRDYQMRELRYEGEQNELQ